MLLKISEYIFIIFGVLLFLALILNKTYIAKLKDNLKKSDYVASIGMLFVFYVLSAGFVGIFIPALYKKIIMFTFSLSPFIIGRFATYEKEKLYTVIQILCVFISVLFVITFG